MWVYFGLGEHYDVCNLSQVREQVSVCLRQQINRGAKSSVHNLCWVSGAVRVHDTVLASDLSFEMSSPK